jgi:hypothetical protein
MTTPPTRLDPLPQELAAPLEKLVYLYVREWGGATVTGLRDALDVPQLRLYPTIDGLAERDLIERRGDDVWIPDVPRAGEAAGARA